MERRVRLGLWGLLGVTMGGAFLLGSCDREPPRKSSSLASRIELAAGNVSVQAPGAASSQAIAGLLLRHGTTVKVGPGDRALIRLDDGSGVFLRHGTEITLKPEGLELSTGEAWVEAPARDKEPALYTTGAVSVSASDAGLDLRRHGSEVEIYVARGLAVVSAPGGRAEVKSGERARVLGDKPPQVSPVSFWEDWTGGMADRRLSAGSGGAASGRIYAIDRARAGAPPQELEIRAQTVRVLVRDGVARTTVDQRFFNPAGSAVEGYYWFTIPEGAAVDRFSLEVTGTLVDGEIVERKQAHAAYEASIQQAVDPALLEWIDGRTFRARIFPIPAAGERRVVLSYLELLPTIDGRTHYIYPLGGAGVTIQEFALEVDLGEAGSQLGIATTGDARVEEGGRRVSMRRSGYRPQGDFLLELTSKTAQPVRAARVESGQGEAAYVMLRYTPDVAWNEVKQTAGHVVLVVDTSAGGDDADRQLRSDVTEAILRSLSTSDRFAVMTVDLSPRVLYPDRGLAAADEANIGKALERLSGVRSGGATDLGAVFDQALQRLHGTAQPAVVYIGDGRATVGELEGDALAERVTRSMAGASARLFTIAVGSDANHAVLGRLARIGGGSPFRVDLAEQAVQEALQFAGQLKTPTITNLRLDLGAGLDQPFSSASGKISRGQEVTLLARSHHALPKTLKVTGELGGKPFSKSYDLQSRAGSEYAYVPTLWARRYLASLLGADAEQNRGVIIRLGLDYGLMTPFTSFLVLESDQAYQRLNIQRRPRNPLWGQVPTSVFEVLAALPLGVFGCSKSRAPAFDESAPTTVARSSHYLTTQAQSPSPGPPPEPGLAPSDHSRRAPRPRVLEGKRARAAAEPAKSLSDGRDQAGEAEPAVEPVVGAEALAICSDASRRPLAHRRALWLNQLSLTTSPQGWLAVYRRAGGQCELPHWRDRKELLDLIQLRASSGAEVTVLLGGLGDPKAQDFVRRQLLRRAVSPDLARASSGSDPVSWGLVEAALARLRDADARIAELRRICEENPRSHGCGLRLMDALLGAGRRAEALALATRLRQEGQGTPALMQRLGDLLSAAGRRDDAIRAYSEIVEFAPADPTARQLLGDIYLRHGWYAEAYRQYRTLTQSRPDDPMSLLRLAGAAAGAGRVDEAVRLEKKVAGGEGEPGPGDPRRWARLWSATRIARLMAAGPEGASESLRQSMERSLKRLQPLAAPGVLFLLTWEDLETRLTWTLEGEGRQLSAAERVDGAASGLLSVTSAPLQSSSVAAVIKRSTGPARKVRLQLTAIVWDGRKLQVTSQAGELAGEEARLTLALPR